MCFTLEVNVIHFTILNSILPCFECMFHMLFAKIWFKMKYTDCAFYSKIKFCHFENSWCIVRYNLNVLLMIENS